MQIACMGVERAGLAMDRVHDALIAMTDVGDVVVAIKVFASVCIPEPDAFTFHEMNGVIVKGCNVRAHKAGPIFDELIFEACHAALKPASMPLRSVCASASLSTNEGERIKLGPDTRTIAPLS